MRRSAWFRWSVYVAGLTASGVAMVVLADVSGFDPVVGLSGTLAIVGAVLATWAMMRSRTMANGICIQLGTADPEDGDPAMVALRFERRDIERGTAEEIGVSLINPQRAREIAAGLERMADKVDEMNGAAHLK